MGTTAEAARDGEAHATNSDEIANSDSVATATTADLLNFLLLCELTRIMMSPELVSYTPKCRQGHTKVPNTGLGNSGTR